MDILWNIFELLVSLFQSCLFVGFTRSFLGCRCGKKADIISSAATGAVLFISIVILNYIIYFEGIAIIVFCVPLLLYSFLFLSGSVAKKIIASVLPILCDVIVASVSFAIASNLFAVEVEDVLLHSGTERFLLLLTANLILVYVFSVIIKFAKKSDFSFNKTEIFLDVAVFIISIAVITFINLINISGSYSRNTSLMLFYCLIGVVIINIAVFYLSSQLSKSYAIRTQNELLIQQLKYQDQYAETAKEQYRLIRHIRHDLKHNLSALSMLLSNGEYKKAEEFLSEYIDTNVPSEVNVETQNPVLNAIINSKFAYAHTFGIKTFCTLPEILDGIDDVDLCNLLGNMLQNAIEYCRKYSDKENKISVIIDVGSSAKQILVKNTIHESVLLKNKELKTDKTDKDNHGLGIKTIKEIVEKYDGFIDYYETSDLLFAKVILNDN